MLFVLDMLDLFVSRRGEGGKEVERGWLGCGIATQLAGAGSVWPLSRILA